MACTKPCADCPGAEQPVLGLHRQTVGPFWTPGRDLRTRRSVQQQSTATTALLNAFGFIQIRPGQREQGYKRLLPRVRDEEVAGFKSCHPDHRRPGQRTFVSDWPGSTGPLSD